MKNFIHSWDDIIDIVKKDKTINFTARAVTPWNALSIDALIALLQDKGIKLNAVIVIAEHYSAGYMITPSFFTNNCAEYYYLPFKKENEKNIQNKAQRKYNISERIISLFRFYKLVFWGQNSTSLPLYFSTFNQNTPDVAILKEIGNIHRKIVICHTEEGVGAYMGTFDKTYPDLKDIKTLGEFHDYIRNVFFGGIVYRFLHNSYNSLTLKKGLFTLKINKEIIPYYKEIFKIRCNSFPPVVDTSVLNKSIVVCTTAWRREDIVGNEDLNVLTEVCTSLWKRGFHLFLKTHPRDVFFESKASQLHCDALNTPGLSMESLCEYAPPLSVISFSSTTLVNPKIFWNIPTYCITDMLNRNNISHFYLDEIDSFKRTFKNIVTFVGTSEEILSNC